MNDDAMIDRVARTMTEGDLPSDFRARVLTALPPARRGSWWRMAIPAGTVAALGVVWMVGTTGTTETTGTTGTTGTTATTSPAGATAELATVLTAAPAAAVPVAAPAEPAEFGPAALEPLLLPAPLVITPIQPIAPSIAPITVDPIIWDRIPS